MIKLQALLSASELDKLTAFLNSEENEVVPGQKNSKPDTCDRDTDQPFHNAIVVLKNVVPAAPWRGEIRYQVDLEILARYRVGSNYFSINDYYFGVIFAAIGIAQHNLPAQVAPGGAAYVADGNRFL